MQSAKLLVVACVTALGLVWPLADAAAQEDAKVTREQATKLFREGNYDEAFTKYKALALTAGRADGGDFSSVVFCLQQLGRIDECDAILEEAAALHKDSWPLLEALADTYYNLEHYGFIIAGQFARGRHRGGGRWVMTEERDRIRSLQLIEAARLLAEKDAPKNALAGLCLNYATKLIGYRGYNDSWRLQYLTDLAILPDYEEGRYHGGGQTAGAPVDADGNPVFHRIPKDFESAASDGERWRWLLVQAMELDEGRKLPVLMQFADFLSQQFGAETLAYYGGRWGGWGMADEDGGAQQTGNLLQLHTLKDTETIARLATGVKRFDLPNEYNFIRIFQQVAAAGKSGYGEQALERLARLFENRRQYPRAADYWRRLIEQYGPGHNNYREAQLKQITGNWGRFEPVKATARGAAPTVDFVFRNGRKVEFEAQPVDVARLLADVKEYLESNPGKLDWQRTRVDEIGYRLVEQNETKYLGKTVAQWQLDLKPAADHFDRRITVTAPMKTPGAYLVTGRLDDGNVSRIILWIADTILVEKKLAQQGYYFVCDAATGAPVAKATVEFFGFTQQQRGNANKYDVITKKFAEFSDADGQVFVKPDALPDRYQWLVTATTPEGRLAYLGFQGVWFRAVHDPEYNATKVFGITDRPVYRPGQKVHFKVWVRHAKYDQEDTSDFARQGFAVRIHDPQGQEFLAKDYQSDEYAGFEGEVELPEEAALGVYRIQLPNHGYATSFRVEEYKKPEFEVTVDAPTEPVMLGEKVTATVKAKYYFGSPVTKAKVKIKVLRTPQTAQWYPYGLWDWFYGRGYWWFAYDYDWYPGWREWGCPAPRWWWWPAPQTPPEVVVEMERAIGEDGTVKVEFNTALAKELHGDSDHRYDITAEVVDESRRTIVGQGGVLVARQPFKVYVWVDGGHYRVGDTVRADLYAQTPAGKPVVGKARLVLNKLSYAKDGEPVETEVRGWDGETNLEGRMSRHLAASEPGQYRLACSVTDGQGHTIEGGYVFCITGEGFDGRQFRFNQIELVPEKREYAPGEAVSLMVNTDRVGSTVLLFARPTNGIYLPPKVMRLDGKSAVEELAVSKKDMPNFFVEALTVSDGKVHTTLREIVVPPEKRVLNVAVTPSATEYKPGAAATVKVKVTDLAGEPVVGAVALTMYDKAVEYISGGSNVREIREFFWKWRRHHNPSTQSNVDRWFGNLLKSKEIGMASLGLFGHLADEGAAGDEMAMGGGFGGEMRRKGGGMMMQRAMAKSAAAEGVAFAMDAAMPMAAAPMLANGMADLEMAEKEQLAAGEGGGEAAAPVTVRTQFADTAFWKGDIITDKDGAAEIALTMPENLTGWKVKAWGLTHGTKVGEGSVEVVTRKNLMLRLQAPRFFVEKDEVVLSANVHNYLDKAKKVQAVLELDGGCLEVIGKPAVAVDVKAGDERRVDWRVKVVREGEAIVRMKALTDEESDAMEMRFPVYVHGMDKMVSFSGVVRPDKESSSFAISVPEQRRVNETSLTVRYSPTLAGALVDALPYLVDYPYGCTEQTLNRFLPTVIVQKIILDMSINLEDVKAKRTNLNAQELGDPAKRAAQWQRYDRNPVFDSGEVRDMVKDGVGQLTAMQVSDGGWGWFSGYGEQSYPHTTAVVVHGLQVALANDVAIVPGVLERGIEWLKGYQAEEVRRLKNAEKEVKPWKRLADDLDALVYMVLADGKLENPEMREFLYRDRTHLSVYANAMLGIGLQIAGDGEKLAMVKRNIGQYLVQDDENQTAYLKLPSEGYWWCWYGGEIETHAFYLKLLARTEPKSEVASRMVKYLLNNRKHATYWNSTRDTAYCIEAMAEYLRASGEDKPDLKVQVVVDGRTAKEVAVNADNLFSFDGDLRLEGDAVDTGEHKIELRKQGKGPLYYNAYLSYFSLEDFITKAGLEIKVQRQVYRLIPEDKKVKVAGSRGQALDQKVEKYRRERLNNLDTLKSGELIEVELEIESKNDYEYIVFEDMKGAGFEPVEVRSGYTGNDLGAYVEFRDERVAFFVRVLARGKHSVSYRLRAEIPGRFSALPTRAHAMYAPELRANSDEIKLQIED